MKPAEHLAAFVKEGLQAGHSAERLRAALLAEGWREQDVAQALDAWADHGLGLPVPRARAVAAGYDTVLYGLLFVTLLVVVWNLVDIAFRLIEIWLPDPLRTGYWSEVSMRWSLATLIVALPLFVWLNQRAVRAAQADPAHRASPTRRKFGALTLFLAALSLLGAAVSVVYAGLTGVVSTQFLAKVALVVVLAGLIIAYFRDYLAQD